MLTPFKVLISHIDHNHTISALLDQYKQVTGFNVRNSKFVGHSYWWVCWQFYDTTAMLWQIDWWNKRRKPTSSTARLSPAQRKLSSTEQGATILDDDQFSLTIYNNHITVKFSRQQLAHSLTNRTQHLAPCRLFQWLKFWQFSPFRLLWLMRMTTLIRWVWNYNNYPEHNTHLIVFRMSLTVRPKWSGNLVGQHSRALSQSAGELLSWLLLARFNFVLHHRKHIRITSYHFANLIMVSRLRSVLRESARFWRGMSCETAASSYIFQVRTKHANFPQWIHNWSDM